MNRISLAFTLMMIITNCKSQSDYYDIAFESKDGICVVNNTTKRKLCFTDVYNPYLSPDGKYLAVTKYLETGKEFSRFISIIDLNKNKELKLNVNNSNFYEANWSLDNQYIAFNILVNHKWIIGIIRSDNTEFKLLKNCSKFGMFSPSWMPDSKYFIAHDMSVIYKFDLECNVIDSIDIQKTFGENHYMSSSTKFIFTPDNKNIVFNCGINEQMKDVEGPVEAIFIYNIASKSITRISPKGMFGYDAFVESDNSILFSGAREGEKIPNIYKYYLAEKKFELFIKEGKNPSTRLR